MSVQASTINAIFASPGVSTIEWQSATRCTCYSLDSKQPQWGHQVCGGFGVIYAPAQTVVGLFRSQSRFFSPRLEGEVEHGEASLTTPITWKPGYVDRRVRDRLTIVNATGDAASGRVFYPAAEPVPFLVNDEHLAWRVQLQSLEQAQRVQPQP